MLEALLSDEEFHGIMKRHVKDILEVLLKRGINFSILTNIADVAFDPPLPTEIRQGFKPITMFYLAGYTFESTQIYNGQISFEACFGNDNFGSLVVLPLTSILQVIIEEIPIFINLSTPVKSSVSTVQKENGQKRSMDAFLSNPENQGLIRK